MFLTHPISAFFLIAAVAIFAIPLIMKRFGAGGAMGEAKS